MAIATAAEQRGALSDFYTSLDTGGLMRRAERLPLGPLRSRAMRQLGRRNFHGVAAERIRSVSPVSQGLYLVVGRVAHAENLAGRLMYQSKRRFDQAVARRLSRSRAAVVVGMYGSSALSFARAHELGRMTVLNFVNSHPVYHNRFLYEFAGLKSGDNEVLPNWVVQEVDREIEHSDLILVPSRFVEAQLLELGVDPQRIATEPYGVDLTAFRPAGPEERAATSEKIVCLYVGQISHRKGITVLLEAARRLTGQPIEFWLAGPMVSRTVLRDMPGNVRYLGKWPHTELPALMRAAHVFVLPSLEDSYGLVTLEAMACGLPVVVSDHAGTSEFVQGGSSGIIVRAGEPGDLVEAIGRLAQNGEERLRMGKAALRQVRAGHSWDHYAERVLDAIGVAPV